MQEYQNTFIRYYKLYNRLYFKYNTMTCCFYLLNKSGEWVENKKLQDIYYDYEEISHYEIAEELKRRRPELITDLQEKSSRLFADIPLLRKIAEEVVQILELDKKVYDTILKFKYSLHICKTIPPLKRDDLCKQLDHVKDYSAAELVQITELVTDIQYVVRYGKYPNNQISEALCTVLRFISEKDYEQLSAQVQEVLVLTNRFEKRWVLLKRAQKVACPSALDAMIDALCEKRKLLKQLAEELNQIENQRSVWEETHRCGCMQ